MCGIFALARPRGAIECSTRALRRATEIVRHRGPDDEGYLLWTDQRPAQVFAGRDTARESRDRLSLREMPETEPWRVALGHRRLSIVDLTPAGHQPMVHAPSGIAVSYNGEIYNHLELRRDLERAGHFFSSHSDTEVLLHAWLEWDAACLTRLNGMFAFVLLDPRNGGTLHAVRDRFGVKPLYFARLNTTVAFASEIKQIRSLPDFVPRVDLGAARDYLAFGLVDHSARTFDEGVTQVRGGEHAVVRLDDPQLRIRADNWYELRPKQFRGGPKDAAAEFRWCLTDSIQLRLRADVPVGSCLSGGLDSSAIVCLASEILKDRPNASSQLTVTACYDEKLYDEWHFAEQVVRQTGAQPVRVWPTVERLQAELDGQLWHMDDPVGSTSQFSQWCVFDGAAAAGLKVMLDGQGSDEQLAGYGGSDAALYSGFMRRGQLLRLVSEVSSFKRRNGALPIAQLILALRNILPGIDALLPAHVRVQPSQPEWLGVSAPSPLELRSARDLNEHLNQQLLATSLPVLLRYEDRNSMARSVESRVPFLDYRLVEFLAGVPDHMKLRRGVTKTLLRDALSDILPAAIHARRDKMGFVTPEKLWLSETATDWFRQGVTAALDIAPNVFDRKKTVSMVESMIEGRLPFTFAPWRILCFGRWLTLFSSGDCGTFGVGAR